MGDQAMELVDNLDILRVNFTSNMKYDIHINTRVQKCKRSMYALSNYNIENKQSGLVDAILTCLVTNWELCKTLEWWIPASQTFNQVILVYVLNVCLFYIWYAYFIVAVYMYT